MDPFTEKLLERTRARRENLQKKMAERPTAANRQNMAKRTREPLAETNSLITEPVMDKAPHPASKPSPSKRKCSGENVQPTAGEENREPTVTHAPPPAYASDPQTDKKPPAFPTTARASLERSAPRPVAQSRLEQGNADRPEGEAVCSAPEPLSSKDVEMVPASLALQRSREEPREEPKEAPTPTTGGMRSRLQRLAEQRNYWDSDGASDFPSCNPPSPVKTQREVEVPPAAVPTASSEAPMGRRGRLANLAATINTWEDDLSHPTIAMSNNGPQGRPGARGAAAIGAGPKPPAVETTTTNQPMYSPVKSSRVVQPSPQKAEFPEVRAAFEAGRGQSSPVASPRKAVNLGQAVPASPQKTFNQGQAVPASPHKTFNQGQAFSSSPQKPVASSGTPMSGSPLRNKAVSRDLDLTSSPRKPGLPAKPATSGPSVLSAREKFAPKDSHTPLQQKATPGAPGVKSFLERFGEKCQERSNNNSPAGASAQAKTPMVTPNTRLVQDRLRAAQTTTTSADLTQRQKMERESELAQIRCRFQKKNKEEVAEVKEVPETKEPREEPKEQETVQSSSDEEPTAPSAESLSPTTISLPAVGHVFVSSPPTSTSSPLRRIDPLELTEKEPSEEEEEVKEEEEVVREVEMNVDQSINSAVINELFDGVLEQSDVEEDEEDEEEDRLNISSMSLLTPLAETVAAVVNSPERRIMTSTPASSFLEKARNVDIVSRPSKFQRACVTRVGSSDSVEALDEDHKLPYSIDAYRSTRVKDTERPNIKQVIVRKEDVTRRAEEPRSQSHTGIKQKMKILTNEMNLQQTVIHQASQALNCCTDEEHGKGSQVEAEAERLLLVATERREALKAELGRLRGEGPSAQKKNPGVSRAQDDVGISATRGAITLTELRLPLKADFVCSTAKRPESACHYFFIMIRAGAENTVATPLASTRSAISGDALSFTTKFTMSDVSNDFEIDLEIYCLVQKREPVNDKRKKPNKSKAITPKRFLAITKSSQTPVVASPGGPNAVRTSNFVLVGSHKLTLSSIGKNKFPLEKVPFLCPLEGHVYLKMQCEVGSKVEERGFLTMFEDVSGFGAWHRRWCSLNGYCISYWTYPDDEKRKNPIGRINLANCTSRRVEPANREFCARPNTFELITVRPQREGDKETLVSQCENTMCVTRNWLSADTKDERNLWMQKLNQILVDLRMWQPDSCYRPV